ncbi:FHA domain-containing protein DDL [Impatiens glandulifera]|uniref:FHA domain-containing protein DDL n=1 Tax=Impatiens glandulifera TaxID=253017 RepID=UPI001FB192B3|nr:FHA domain-containing protein DDL [Impatiens glandulifera]
MGRGLSNRSESPTRHHRSPRKRSPSGREKSPSHRRRSPVEQPKLRSSVSRSPSPRTKRLRRARVDGESERVSEKDEKRSHRTRSDRDRDIHKEKNFVKEIADDGRKERGSRKDAVGNGSVRTRNGRSKSPVHHRSKNESQSPPSTSAKREGIPDSRKKERSGRDASGSGSYRSTNRRSTSPSAHHNRSRHESRSSPSAADNHEVRSSRGDEHRNEDDDPLEKMNATQEALETKEKQKPSFELSGKLADETNRVKGVTLLFNEPPDARKPDIRWRLYVFKGGEALNDPLYVHRQTCYLFGRERRVADIPTDHPSCSKQHAVLQYRLVEKEQPDGMLKKKVTPYIMDLGSTNGTFINETQIEAQRYYELHEQDTLKFGNSSREYVLLHENSSN